MAFGLKDTTILAERRRAQRESINVAVVARTLAGQRIPLMVEVLSPSGFLASTPQTIAKGSPLDIFFPTARAMRAEVVWIEDGKIGCRFAAPANIPDLLKPAQSRSPVTVERRDFRGFNRNEVRLPSGEAVEAGIAGGETPKSDAAPDPRVDEEESAWLDSFGWLPIDTAAAICDHENPHLRPILLRSGFKWAFGGMAATGWIDMTESRLGETLDFAPTLWTPVSDDLAADLSDL